MTRWLLAVVGAAVLLSGCKYAVKHPPIAAGIVVGTLGMGTCELASSEHARCAGLSAGAGVAIALITAFALWLGYEDDKPPSRTSDNDTDTTYGVDPHDLPPAPLYLPPTAVDAGVDGQ